MKVTKNSPPSSEWEFKDKCPSCGSFCDIHKDLNENDECNDCRSSKTAVEFILNLDLGLDEQGKEFRVKDALSVNEIRKAKEMEKEQSLKMPPYDLDKLAEDMLKSHKDFKAEGFSDYHNGRLNGINEGFQKALELLTFKSE